MTAERPGARVVAVDATLLALASAVALLPFGDAWSGSRWALAAALGVLAGAGLVVLAARLRWGLLLTALLLALGYLLLGPLAAAPDQALAGVLPSVDAERTLVTGVIESWRTVLTLPGPLGTERGELVVPFLTALVGAALAAAFLWRSRWPSASALVVVAMYAVAAAFGTREADLPLARGALLLVVLLVWTRWRALRHLSTSWLRRGVLGAVLLGVAGGIGWAATAVVPDTGTREVLRDHVEPPLARLDFKSPLAAYRSYYKDHKTDVLFTFEGLPAGDTCVRLASMDTFDGVVWNVSTTDRRNGSSAFGPAPASERGDAVTVTVHDYRGTWVPTVGAAEGVSREHDAAPGADRELLVNPASGAIADYGGVREDDSYRVDWDGGVSCTNDARASDADRSVPPAPISFAIEPLDELVAQLLGRGRTATDYERVVTLERGFQEGYFNDGLDPKQFGYSASGHGAKRLADLAQDPTRMVGNDEQYASALAYAVQKQGIPARVVLGFEKVRGDGTVTGDDVAAWVEVPFEGFGWMRFDPTPPEDRTPPPLDDSPDEVPQPYVVQPPVLPQEPADVQGVPPEGSGRDSSGEIWDLLWKILGILWLILRIVLLLSPLWLILLVKRVRRRRRRRAADPVDRLSGGWRELTDRARDLGVRLPVGHTRHENGLVLDDRFATEDATVLAVEADRHVFGPGLPSDAEVAAYWEDVGTAVRRMRKATPWWRRWLSAFSPASVPWREGLRTLRARLGRAFGRFLRRVFGWVRLPWRRAAQDA